MGGSSPDTEEVAVRAAEGCLELGGLPVLLPRSGLVRPVAILLY
jgi:hypothetical protein